MLVDFSFSNFKCFWDTQQFSMERVRQATDEKQQVNRVTALYGGNAAGKSSFVDALSYMSNFVRDSFADAASASGTKRNANRIVRSAKETPSSFYIRFTTPAEGGYPARQYEYEFAVDDFRVTYERLNVWTSSRASKLFERRASDDLDGDPTVDFGASFRGSKSLYKKALKNNALLLSVIASTGNKAVLPAFEYITQRIHVYKASAYTAESDNIIRLMQSNSAYAEALQLLLRESDLGINGLTVDTSAYDKLLDKLTEAKNQDAVKMLYSAFVDLTNDDATEDEKARLVANMMSGGVQADPNGGELVFSHSGGNGSVPFTAHDESDGTLATIAFLSVALRDLLKHSVTVVDEIDTSLHPAMVRQLISLYERPETNSHDSQLIFTTHDASLLMNAINGEDALDPDQFWIVEKRDGASELYPATSIGIEADEDMARNYLNGVYGGVLYPRLQASFARALALLEEDAYIDERRRHGGE